MDDEQTTTAAQPTGAAASTPATLPPMTDAQFDRYLKHLDERSKPTPDGVQKALEDQAATQDAGGDGAARDVEAVELLTPEMRGAAVRNRRDVDEEGWKWQVFRLFQGLYTKQSRLVNDARILLARAGHYGEDVRRAAMTDETRAVMVTGTEGSPFLPTIVLNKIEDIMKEFGVARRLCTIVTFSGGTAKIPNVSGRFDAFAVNEGSIIKARAPSFGSQTLDPDKWGVIVPWSNEITEEVGPQMVDKVIELAGEAFAAAEDKTVFTADGTATYHSLTGLLNNGSIGEHTMSAGNNLFTELTYKDIIDLRGTVDPSVRKRGTFVFHHDIEQVLLKLQDAAGGSEGTGSYIFPPGTQTVDRLAGRPVEYSEALPDLTEDAAGVSFGLYGDFSFVTMGFQRNLQARLLEEATIQDVNDSDLIHLAAQDAQALRFTALWDVKFGLTGAFGKITTGST